MKITELQRGDVIIAHVGCGTMPPQRCKAYMETILTRLRTLFPEHHIIGIGSEKKKVKLEVIRPAMPSDTPPITRDREDSEESEEEEE